MSSFNKSTKIGFYKLGLNKPKIKTMFWGMYWGFFNAISRQGYGVTYIEDIKNINSVDILILPMGGGQDQESCRVMSHFKNKVILHTPPANSWFKVPLLKRWKTKILFVYSVDNSKFSKNQYGSLGITHYCLPFASDKIPKFYDVIFVANALSGTGRYKYIDLLMRKANKKNWRVLLLGHSWEKYNFPIQLVAHGDLLNIIYNSAKICINLNNDKEKLGENIRLDANNRLFDLAMAGCFQISNAPQVVRKYFSKNEVVAIDDPIEWVNKIEYYLKHKDERKKISKNTRLKALKEHTWDKRAKKFIEAINENINKKNLKTTRIKKVQQKLDHYPYLLSCAKKRIKKIIYRIYKKIFI